MAAEVLEQAEQEPEHDFGPVDYDRVRQHVITQLGRDYITYSGLIELLHQVSEGYFAIDTALVQAPTQDNGQVAICTAQVLVYDPENPDVVRRRASGIGDANPANVNRMMGAHLIRMAETRAKARALRDAVNVGMVSVEELGPQGADDATERQAPATSVPFTAQDRIEVRGKVYTRDQIWTAYQARLVEAKAVGLAVPDDQGGLKREAPLPVIVGASQELRRRMQARAGE